jgi:hypothetical protein
VTGTWAFRALSGNTVIFTAEDLQPPCFEDLEQADSLTWAGKCSAGPLSGAAPRTRIVIPKSDFDRRQQAIAQLSADLEHLTGEWKRISAVPGRGGSPRHCGCC